jgi:hypothetical protein
LSPIPRHMNLPSPGKVTCGEYSRISSPKIFVKIVSLLELIMLMYPGVSLLDLEVFEGYFYRFP